MTKKKEIIEQLTKDMSSRSRKKLIAFWSGRGSLTGQEYLEFAQKIEEYKQLMSLDNMLDDYLIESKRAYLKHFEQPGHQKELRGI